MRASQFADTVRWDRLGRFALLLLLGGIIYLYLGPVSSYVDTWQEAKAKREQVAKLEREHQQLLKQRKLLESPRELERQARELGMLREGERPYSIEGLKP